jgi:probable F420-dependent oxidoreductase
MTMTTSKRFRIGTVFPQVDMPADPVAIRDFAQALEGLGYDHMVIYDHVVGADLTNRPEWNKPYSVSSTFQEPLVLMAYLAALTTRLEFMTGVLILPQRQTVLVAKQAACIDLYLNGRLRLAVGTGWNEVEYEALGADFASRGAMLDEQIDFMRKLWTQESFSYDGRFHKLTEAGLCPMPQQRPIPLWIGGNAPPAMRRAAKVGDGWLPVHLAANAASEIARFRDMVEAGGRDPDSVGIENLVFAGNTMRGGVKTPGETAVEIATWREAGADGIAVHTLDAGLGGPDGHIAFLRELREELGGS